MIGVVSYLPNDIKLRHQRLVASQFQFEWLHKLFSDEKINVVAQNYMENERDKNYVNYICFDSGIGAGKARNVILEMFYKSNEDWLLLCDDDTIIDDKYNYQYFIKDIFSHPEKFETIDAVSAIEPEYHPYKKLNYEDKANLTHYKFEPRELNSGSATSIIRNIKKYYGKELYYPDIDANKGEGREDIEFLLLWLKNNLTWYNMNTMIRKSLCFDKSSIFGSDTKSRDIILMHDLDVICRRYAKDGITRGVNGQITWKKFNERFNKTQKLLYIKRNKNIEFEENVIPKEKKSNIPNLF